jgi:hypothetical protein
LRNAAVKGAYKVNEETIYTEKLPPLPETADGPVATLEKPRIEEFQVTGEALITKVKELIHEGNVRRIILKNEQSEIVAEFPLTVGVVGAVFLPVWAAIGAIAALVANMTIVVEHRE